jgi:hypothetical protein
MVRGLEKLGSQERLLAAFVLSSELRVVQAITLPLGAAAAVITHMRKSTHRIRAGALPAIAAALALSSTAVLAQQVQPVPADPVPVTTPAPATTPDQAAPAAAGQSSPADTSATAPAETTSAAPTTHAVRTVKHATRIATASTAPAAHTSVHATTVRTTARASAPAAPAAARPAAPAAPVPSPTAQPAVTPVVNVNSSQQPAKSTAAPMSKRNTMPPIAAAGVLALLVIAAAAFALMRRRRRVDEDMWADDNSAQYEPVDTAMVDEPEQAPMIHEEQPAIVAPAPSAFAWGNDAPSQMAQSSDESMVEDERQGGESWIERAYRGPSPSNPSVSLKARLKRAAFFDKRERDAAAGRAEPIDTSAGLPDALVEEQEGELA